MKYIALINSAESLGTISAFVVNQLESHFQSWSSMDKDSDYSLRWRKNSLILETDSSFIFGKWLNVEKQYLVYLLDESQFTVANNIETMLEAEDKYKIEELLLSDDIISEELFDTAA